MAQFDVSTSLRHHRDSLTYFIPKVSTHITMPKAKESAIRVRVPFSELQSIRKYFQVKNCSEVIRAMIKMYMYDNIFRATVDNFVKKLSTR